MAKVADIRLGWKKSVSADVTKIVIETSVNGTVTTTEGGPEVEEILVTAAALSAIQFKVTTYDSEGLQTVSLTHDFVLGDLEAPAPATDLFHEIVAIRDVPDA